MKQFFDAFVPNTSAEDRKDPSISPYYENLEPFRGRLPAALFTCGTEDPLLDDTIVMSTKWMMAGGTAVVKIYPGAPHGFIEFSSAMLNEAGELMNDTHTFIKDCLQTS
jgi:acetyl esterase/lipase